MSQNIIVTEIPVLGFWSIVNEPNDFELKRDTYANLEAQCDMVSDMYRFVCYIDLYNKSQTIAAMGVSMIDPDDSILDTVIPPEKKRVLQILYYFFGSKYSNEEEDDNFLKLLRRAIRFEDSFTCDEVLIPVRNCHLGGKLHNILLNNLATGEDDDYDRALTWFRLSKEVVIEITASLPIKFEN